MLADLLVPLPSPTYIAPCTPHRPSFSLFVQQYRPTTTSAAGSSTSAGCVFADKGTLPYPLKRKFGDQPSSPLCSPPVLSPQRTGSCVKRSRGGATMQHHSVQTGFSPAAQVYTGEQRISTMEHGHGNGNGNGNGSGSDETKKRMNPFTTASPDAGPSTAFPALNNNHYNNVSHDNTAMPPPPPATVPRRSTSPNFPQPPSLNRNPKKLSLSLKLPASPGVGPGPSSTASSTDTIVPTPSASANTTPYTPGPPKTPALAMSVGQNKAIRRPSLLSLITQPPTSGGSGYDAAPPTAGMQGSFFSQAAADRPSFSRARSSTGGDSSSRAGGSGSSGSSTRSSRSAYPGLSLSTFRTIQEDQTSTPSVLTTTLSASPPSSTLSTTPSSCSLSLRTTPASSPPLVERQPEPYEHGPIEIVPGVWLGAEESVARYDVWAAGPSGSSPSSNAESSSSRSSGPLRRVRILNVAQEIDDPFEEELSASAPVSLKGKEKARRAVYPAVEGTRPEVEYVHLRWGHGEGGLVEVDSAAELDDLFSPGEEADDAKDGWRFWQAIRWMEQGRCRNEPVLIHCQCGVSRSATLAIAYIMALAAMGTMPDRLGKIDSMQAAYDFIKAKSPCIGPNVSLVFQLVEFSKNVSSLLSKHLAKKPENASLRERTSFPTNSDTMSEDEWARRRRAFDEQEEEQLAAEEAAADQPYLSKGRMSGAGAWPAVQGVSPEDVQGEARRLDEEMIRRRLARV